MARETMLLRCNTRSNDYVEFRYCDTDGSFLIEFRDGRSEGSIVLNEQKADLLRCWLDSHLEGGNY